VYQRCQANLEYVSSLIERDGGKLPPAVDVLHGGGRTFKIIERESREKE